jgi:hypothetical protein
MGGYEETEVESAAVFSGGVLSLSLPGGGPAVYPGGGREGTVREVDEGV